MWKNLAIVLLVFIVGLLAWASTRPDSFRVERRITIQAPPDRVFPLINDFHQWARWSPWEKKDPAMNRRYSGPDSGVGAGYEWSGNRDVGSGRMEIVQSMPDSRIAVGLHFKVPFAADNTAEFVLEGKDGSTTVTWAMFGPSPFLSKVISLFMDMDGLLGGDFEAGLPA